MSQKDFSEIFKKIYFIQDTKNYIWLDSPTQNIDYWDSP